jgi:sugar phosphate permease
MGEKEIFETSTHEDLESSGNSSAIDPAAEKKLVRKYDIRVVPLLFLLYVLAYLDRINIGNAKIEGMPKELKMKGNDYNVALLVFFIPYIILEVPSNLILKNIDPPKWLSGMMFICGMVQSIMRFWIQTHYSCQVYSPCAWALSRPSSSLLLCGFFLACLSLDTIPDAYIS